MLQPKRGHIETWWLIGPDREPEAELGCHTGNPETVLDLTNGD